jgi:methionyl-tRNA synthetase
VPFGNDGDFSRRALINRINSELANGFGNLGQRTLSFIAKNCDGRMPEPAGMAPADRTLLAAAESLCERMRTALDEQAIHQALQAWVDVVDAANKYIDDQAPWALRKSDPQRMRTVLWVLAEAIRHLAILVQPFVPEAASKLLDQLGVTPAARAFSALGEAGRLVPGTPLPPPQGVFPRFVEGEGRAG